MKAVIFAGGLGTRLSEETGVRPKPMVEIEGKPILWHIMKIYEANGINDFVICCGYKSHIIKEFFANYTLNRSNVIFDTSKHAFKYLNNPAEKWRVTLIETGDNTMTSGRLRKVRDYLDEEDFCLTYGDGVTDLNIQKTIKFHKKEKAIVTLAAVQPPGRFGVFNMDETQTKLESFHEKPKGDGAWINGGFFVVSPKIFDYELRDDTMWENGPLKLLAQEGKLAAYKHVGFWQNMDTLRDKQKLEELWSSGHAPWKIWE